jgi:hypothetical protein
MFCFTSTKGDQIAKVYSHFQQLESTDLEGIIICSFLSSHQQCFSVFAMSFQCSLVGTGEYTRNTKV